MSASRTPDDLPVGTIVAGKYRIAGRLGSGGMCVVYEAEHVHLQQGVALKILKTELCGDGNAIARFGQEAQAAATLRSLNVARVYDVDRLPDGRPYICMELLIGHDVRTELDRRRALSIEEAVDIVRQAASGIAEAHAMGIVHRDLKPENLFLSDLGKLTSRRLVKILDFGIAKDVRSGARKLTSSDSVFGTVDYMSPEQIRSSTNVDHRTDIWALGVILYELITGSTPFTGDSRSVVAQIISDPVPPPHQLVPSLPGALSRVIMKALAKDANGRFASADEFRHELSAFCTNLEPIEAVFSALPAASVPRRVRPATDPVTPPLSVRPQDHATALTFERHLRHKAWTRPFVALPLFALMGTCAGVLVWKREDLLRAATGSSSITVTAPSASLSTPLVPASPVPAAVDTPMAAPQASVPTLSSATSPSPSVTTEPARPAPAPSTAPARPKPMPAPARANSAKPRADREASDAPAPAPAPTPAPAALPKHL